MFLINCFYFVEEHFVKSGFEHFMYKNKQKKIILSVISFIRAIKGENILEGEYIL